MVPLRDRPRLVAACGVLLALLAAGAAHAAADSLHATPADSTLARGAEATASRNVLERAVRGTGFLLSDLGYVVSAPARMNRRSAAATGAVLGVTGVLYAYDQDISDAAWRNWDAPVFQALIDFAETYEPFGFMPRAFQVEAGTSVVGYLIRNEPLQQIGIECIESHLISGGIRNVLKTLVGRAHPYENLGPRHFEFNNGTSFPSGHTSIYFEVATVVSEHVDRLPVTAFLYSCAVLGAAQRVESKNHWSSDVFVPAVTSTLIARTVVRRNDERRQRERGESAGAVRPGWTPALAAAPGRLELRVTRALD